MNIGNLPALIAEMRALGIKSLALELTDDSGSPAIAHSDDRATLAPDNPEADPDLPPKQPNQCVAVGCSADRKGLFGSIGGQYCREHALQRAGVRTS